MTSQRPVDCALAKCPSQNLVHFHGTPGFQKKHLQNAALAVRAAMAAVIVVSEAKASDRN